MSYRYRGYGSRGARAVWAIIIACVVVYLATALASLSQYPSGAMVDQFGIQRQGLASHPWTLVTSLFLHYGIYHILGNMLTLFWFGMVLVGLIGETKFLVLYFGAGIIGNLVFVGLAPHSVAVGASGAIFGVAGALAVMRPRAKVMIFPIPVPLDLWIAVVLGFVVLSFLPGVGWQAHLGGLATGLAAGWYFRRWERSRGIYG